LDGFDLVEGLVIRGGIQVEVLNGLSLHGGLVASWPHTPAITASFVVEALLEYWQAVGLPGYAQFDNDPKASAYLWAISVVWGLRHRLVDRRSFSVWYPVPSLADNQLWPKSTQADWTKSSPISPNGKIPVRRSIGSIRWSASWGLL
jgi:hypothetical protein